MSSNGQWLSHSRTYTYNKCRQLFKYKYIDKLKPQLKDMHFDSWERMNRGVLVHAAMEAGFTGRALKEMVGQVAVERIAVPGVVLSREQRMALPKMQTDSCEVAERALEWLPVQDWRPVVHPQSGVPMVEAELRVGGLGPNWGGFLGYADLVAEHVPTGAVYVLDYKTRVTFEPEDSDQYNAQFALYQHALSTIGVETAGSVLVEIKPEPASRASRTTYIDNGGIIGVRTSVDGRFRTTTTFRSRSFVANYWQDFQRQADTIGKFAAGRGAAASRNMSSFNCKRCEYQLLCMGELHGYDTAAIIRDHYGDPDKVTITLEEDGA